MSVTIRLQYLPLSAAASDIRAFFSGLRIPDGAVHIVGGEDGDAFIGFASDEDARQAMSRSGGKIHGTEVRLLLSSRAEMNEIIARVKSGKTSRPPISSPPNEPVNNQWEHQNPSRYVPDQDQSQPAYARIQKEPIDPSYSRVPPPNNNPAYTTTMPSKEPTYPSGNPPVGRQPNVRQMSYGDTENHYEASPAYKSPMYQQSPALPETKPYSYNSTDDRKDVRQSGPSVLSPEAEEAISKLPPHLRPPHGIPPPHLRYLFPSQNATSPTEKNLRDPTPRRDEPPRHFNQPPRQDFPPRDRFPPGRHPDRSQNDRFGPPQDRYDGSRNTNNGGGDSWRAGPGPAPWDSRTPLLNNEPNGRNINDKRVSRFGPPVAQPMRPSSRDGRPPLLGRAPPADLFIELSRLPNDLWRPAAIESFLRPSVPFSVSSVKVVFSPQGIHLHTLIRVDSQQDFERFLRQDGFQGIRVRPTNRRAFEEAIDGIPPAVSYRDNGIPLRPPSREGPPSRDRPPSRGIERPPSRDRRRGRSRSPPRSPPIRRRRGESPRRRSRSRSPRRRVRSRSPEIKRTGRQDPNRWCLMLTNVPFKIEAEEIIAELRWMSERVRPMKLTRTYYSDGNASDRWVAEFESESTMKRAKNHRAILNGRSIKMTHIDNDYADEIMAIEDKYGEQRKKEYDMKQMAELQLQHLNGTLGPHGVPRFFNNNYIDPAASYPQVQQQHYLNVGPKSPRENGHMNSAPRGGMWGGRGRGRGFGNVPYHGPPGYPRRHERIHSDSERKLEIDELKNPDDIEFFSSIGPSGSVVTCKGFPSDITLQDIVGFFYGFPVDENSVKIKIGDDQIGTGDAVLCIPDPEKAREAVEALNGRELRGSIVNLRLPSY